MSAFIGNYLQHIMDILVEDGYTYDDICDAYGIEKITVEAVRKSHKGQGRGNLPSGISASRCYECLVSDLYMDIELRKGFARSLHASLTRDDMFPPEWNDRIEKVSGFDEGFDPDIFCTYFVDLLTRDKRAKKGITKLSTMKKDEISIQKEIKSSNVKAQSDSVTPLAFSSRFFNAGARAIVDATDSELENALEQLSSIFYNISTLEFKNTDKKIEPDSRALLADIRDYVIESIHKNGGKEILKIKGPLGSYKNRIMQYLYIALERKAEDFIPLYIDVASYEKAAEGNEGIDEKDFWNAFDSDIKKATEIVSKSPEKTPLLMLDGIRDFNCRNESLYYSISESVQKLGWDFIICMDTEFTINNQNKYAIHPLVSNNFDCYLRIHSMNLNRKHESIEFIKNCISVFSLALPEGITAEQIYDSLVRLNFLTIDAYWLIYILNAKLTEIVDPKNNISGLYNALCLSFLGSHKMVDSAAEFAYEFEFGKRNFNNTNPYFDLRWRLIRKHRSVLDFLIAKFYIKKVSELNLENGTREQNIKKLSFFNMVLQKNITRFVVTMLKGIDDYERQIMIIAKKYYDELELFGKSELTFWMARLQNPVRKKECVKFLQSYNQKELKRYREDKFASVEEKRKAAFLIRGISVSLIYENDKAALKYYLESLLTDKIANSVNRGFHLEYYGDKPYIPNKALLDFEDDVTKGESTLTVICLSLDRRMRRRDVSSPVALLEIMTLCNLIQARLERNQEVEPLDVSPYIDKCIRYLEWIMQQRILKGLKEVCVYFHWIHNELQAFKARNKGNFKGFVYNRSSVLDKFGKASDVARTGWVNMEVPKPENIVEHMYNCWLMGMLYLPDSCEHPDYNKNDILQMLLIHDLGEAQTGDINRPEKRENQSYYDHQERMVMQGLFLSGTYPSSVNLNQYLELWNVWDERKGINYLVAKDIDNIQTIYQFCNYFLKYPDKFSQEDAEYWLAGLHEIETDIGKDIADMLISTNPEYESIVKLSRIYED